MSEDDSIIIGRRIAYSDTPAEVFGLSRRDRRRHLYVQGKTGSGKSTLLLNMIVQDIVRGEGVCFIDPLGHNAEALLAHVPKWRTDHVCYLNVADLERPVGLNILAGYEPMQRHKAVAAVIDVCSSIWDLSLARQPQLLDVLGYALAALTEVPDATLLQVSRFLTDDGYRERMLSSFVADPAVRSYWQEFGTQSRRERNEMCKSVLNKLNELRRATVMRNIFGQTPNKLDFTALIENRGILIVNLAKSEIGLEYARLLGTFIVSQIALAASSRMQALARCVEDDPIAALYLFPDFYTYIDEFQDLATNKFNETLSQSRNGRVSFILFNQFQAQLSEEVKGALFGNVGSLMSFEVGADDAECLARQFDHHFKPEELTALRQHEMALKFPKRDGNPPLPFKAYTFPLWAESYGTKRRVNITAQSRMRYGRAGERVERTVERMMLTRTVSKQPKAQRVRQSVPKAVFVIQDASGRVVQTLTGSAQSRETAAVQGDK